MFRISTTNINKKIISNNITSNAYLTPNIKHHNSINAFESLLNPSSDNNTHIIQQTSTPSDLVIDEQYKPKQKIVKRINLNNFNPLNPIKSQSHSKGNQNTIKNNNSNNF
eukprot:64230_1